MLYQFITQWSKSEEGNGTLLLTTWAYRSQYSTSKHPQLESFKRTLTSYDNGRRRMVLFSLGTSPHLRAGTLCTHYLSSCFLLYEYPKDPKKNVKRLDEKKTRVFVEMMCSCYIQYGLILKPLYKERGNCQSPLSSTPNFFHFHYYYQT